MQKQVDPIERAKKKVSPQAYAQYLKALDLLSISLTSLRAKVHSHKMSESNSLTFKEAVKTVGLTDSEATIEVKYEVKAKSGKRNIAEVVATYSAAFTLAEPIPEEFFTIYSAGSLPLQTYPYFRQLVDAQFTAMNLPRITMPLRKGLIGKPKSD